MALGVLLEPYMSQGGQGVTETPTVLQGSKKLGTPPKNKQKKTTKLKFCLKHKNICNVFLLAPV